MAYDHHHEVDPFRHRYLPLVENGARNGCERLSAFLALVAYESHFGDPMPNNGFRAAVAAFGWFIGIEELYLPLIS